MRIKNIEEDVEGLLQEVQVLKLIIIEMLDKVQVEKDLEDLNRGKDNMDFSIGLPDYQQVIKIKINDTTIQKIIKIKHKQ